ncbi:GGDEF domain-containing protein [Mycobacterium sp.]|uniref:GGDEF domain-containing protein n=1 Tax=Mycobacterium sp. TaxID=1785 RepID=UPI003C72322C
MDSQQLPSSPPASLPRTRGFTNADYVRGMERLLQAVQELSLARSLPDIQHIVRSSARELTGCDGATFVLRDNDKCYYAEEDAIAPLWKGSRFPIETCISGWAMLNRDAAVIPDIYRDPRIPHATYLPTFVKSMVMVPIRRLDPIGAIGNYWARPHRPSGQEVSLLQALADSTSIAMENLRVNSELEQRVRDRTAALEKANEEIRQLSVTDELTRLNNRRGFYLLAEPALRAARRHGSDCLLAFLDVDGLKRVNDEHGHHVGDTLIADVGQVLRATLRETDILARMGGDEFCVLVTEPEGPPAMLRKRLVEAFQCFNATRNRPYRLSASIGVVQAPATDSATVDELIARADDLMYGEKKTRLGSPLAD